MSQKQMNKMRDDVADLIGSKIALIDGRSLKRFYKIAFTGRKASLIALKSELEKMEKKTRITVSSFNEKRKLKQNEIKSYLSELPSTDLYKEKYVIKKKLKTLYTIGKCIVKLFGRKTKKDETKTIWEEPKDFQIKIQVSPNSSNKEILC
jgi:hypothetical protein